MASLQRSPTLGRRFRRGPFPFGTVTAHSRGVELAGHVMLFDVIHREDDFLACEVLIAHHATDSHFTLFVLLDWDAVHDLPLGDGADRQRTRGLGNLILFGLMNLPFS